MKKEELLLILKEDGANEAVLADTGCDYTIRNESTIPGIIGYAIIMVEEGVLSLPYIAVLPEDGYEQFLLDGVELIDLDEISSIIADAEYMLKTLKEFYSKLLNKKTPDVIETSLHEGITR
jgi:hypothetical protein